MKSEIMRLPLYCIIFLLYKTEGSPSTYDISNAVSYIKRYTRVKRGDVMFWADPSFLQHTFEDTIAIVSEYDDSHTTTFTGIFRNRSSLMYRDLAFPSVVILPDFEHSEEVQKGFFDLPRHLLRENIWLIGLSKDYNDEGQINEFLKELTSKYFGHVRKFELNSKIFVIARVKEISLLFELYQKCNTRDISAIMITSLGHISKTDSKYIWENRKDLSNCLI